MMNFMLDKSHVYCHNKNCRGIVLHKIELPTFVSRWDLIRVMPTIKILLDTWENLLLRRFMMDYVRLW